jgi:hypothetical protein
MVYTAGLGFHSGVDGNSNLLGCHAMYVNTCRRFGELCSLHTQRQAVQEQSSNKSDALLEIGTI